MAQLLVPFDPRQWAPSVPTVHQSLSQLLALYGSQIRALTVWPIEGGWQVSVSSDGVAWTVKKTNSIEAGIAACIGLRFTV